jgi:hypothetical protein
MDKIFHLWGTQFNELPNWVGMGKTTNNNNNNRDQTNISTHLREGVYIYLHTLAEFEVPVLRPISDLMLETKLERSKGFN